MFSIGVKRYRNKLIYFLFSFHGKPLQKAFASLILRYLNNFAFSSALAANMKYSSRRHVL